MQTQSDVTMRKVEDRDIEYMQRLADRYVPLMSIYRIMRGSGIDVKQYHLERLAQSHPGEGPTKHMTIRMPESVVAGIRDLARKYGYEFYTDRGVVGVVPPFLSALVDGKIKLVVDDGETPAP